MFNFIFKDKIILFIYFILILYFTADEFVYHETCTILAVSLYPAVYYAALLFL